MADNNYFLKRNMVIREIYKSLRNKGYRARPAMIAIRKELRGELSLERIRKILYSKDVPPVRQA